MLNRFTSPFREFGWLVGLLYGIDRCLQRISPSLRLYIYELLIQPIPETPLLPGKLARAFEYREISKGDPEVAQMPARPDIKELRFQQNAACIGAFQKNRLVGYIWLAFRAYQEDEVRCNFILPNDGQSVFDFDLYIMPEARMGLAFAGVWDGASQYLRGRGVKYTYSRLTRVNIASRRAHRRLGTQCVGRMIVLHAWSVELTLSSVSPYAHLSLSKQDRVSVKLRNIILPERPAAREPALRSRQLL